MSFDHQAHFRKQAEWSDRLGSPFTAALLRRAADDFTSVAPIVSVRSTWREGDNSALRLAGALNAAVLSGRAPRLAALYPPTVFSWDMDDIWREACALFQSDSEWLRRFLIQAPQTNETRRAIALLPAFLELARYGPLHLLEVGASAGLNLNWPLFRYTTSAWNWGSNDPAAPHISTDWSGTNPDIEASVSIASRTGCDIHPLSASDPTDRLRLKSYIWPDQADRVERFDRAADLAVRTNVGIEKEDAGDWLARQLDRNRPEGVTVVYHSIMWPYLADATRHAVAKAISEASEKATPQRRLAHVQFEDAELMGLNEDGYAVHLRLWPDEVGRSRLVARADPHARWVEAL